MRTHYPLSSSPRPSASARRGPRATRAAQQAGRAPASATAVRAAARLWHRRTRGTGTARSLCGRQPRDDGHAGHTTDAPLGRPSCWSSFDSVSPSQSCLPALAITKDSAAIAALTSDGSAHKDKRALRRVTAAPTGAPYLASATILNTFSNCAAHASPVAAEREERRQRHTVETKVRKPEAVIRHEEQRGSADKCHNKECNQQECNATQCSATTSDARQWLSRTERVSPVSTASSS